VIGQSPESRAERGTRQEPGNEKENAPLYGSYPDLSYVTALLMKETLVKGIV
jgi:hypothetical protein